MPIINLPEGHCETDIAQAPVYFGFFAKQPAEPAEPAEIAGLYFKRRSVALK
jgi:hypothetical protein